MFSLLPLAIAALATAVHGNPIPNPQDGQDVGQETGQDIGVVGVGTLDGDPIAEANIVCRLAIDSPATWRQTGAEFFLNDQLEKNGEDNWLRNLDQRTTNIENFVSILDCKPLGGSSCFAPTGSCPDFTPPELFFIRAAAVNAHDFFTRAHEKLQDVTIENILSIDKMISEFNANTPSSAADTLSVIGSAFSIAEKLFEISSPALANGASIIGGLFGLASALPGPEQVDLGALKVTMQSQLLQLFTQTNDRLTKLNSKLFGGKDDIDIQELVNFIASARGVQPSTNLHPISQVFEGGSFLVPPSDSQLDEGLNAGMKAVKQSIVGSVLRAMNYYVFVDTTRDENACNAITGARWINNECFTLERRLKPVNAGDPDTEPLAAEMVLKLDSEADGYNIDMNAFYENVRDCNNDKPVPGVDLNSSFSKCFFNVPFIRAEKLVCLAMFSPDLDKLPDALELNDSGCDPQFAAGTGSN